MDMLCECHMYTEQIEFCGLLIDGDSEFSNHLKYNSFFFSHGGKNRWLRYSLFGFLSCKSPSSKYILVAVIYLISLVYILTVFRIVKSYSCWYFLYKRLKHTLYNLNFRAMKLFNKTLSTLRNYFG